MFCENASGEVELSDGEVAKLKLSMDALIAKMPRPIIMHIFQDLFTWLFDYDSRSESRLLPEAHDSAQEPLSSDDADEKLILNCTPQDFIEIWKRYMHLYKILKVPDPETGYIQNFTMYYFLRDVYRNQKCIYQHHINLDMSVREDLMDFLLKELPHCARKRYEKTWFSILYNK